MKNIITFPSDRPLLLDKNGVPRAVVLIHSQSGIDITGELLPAIPPEDLLESTSLKNLFSAVQKEDELRSLELDAMDHAAIAVRTWALDIQGEKPFVTLAMDPIMLSQWVASRTIFATLSTEDRISHTQETPLGVDALFGTHLGYTATVVTSDNQLVCVRRTGKLLADGLSDSAIGDTALLSDVVAGSWSAHDAIIIAGKRFLGLEPTDFESLTVALVAVRVDDSGLWVSGHAKIKLTAEELVESVMQKSNYPDASRVRFLPWNKQAAEIALSEGEWTPWGIADLASAISIDFGEPIQKWN